MMENVLGIGLLTLSVAVTILFIVIICQQKKIIDLQQEIRQRCNELDVRIGRTRQQLYPWLPRRNRLNVHETLREIIEYLGIEWHEEPAKSGYRKKKLVRIQDSKPKGKKKS